MEENTKKKVRFRVTTEYEVELPADWSDDTCEFWANDGSWCVANMWQDMADADDCGCFRTEMRVISTD